MPILVKKGGVYVESVAVFAKKAGAYVTATGVSAKQGGAYASASVAVDPLLPPTLDSFSSYRVGSTNVWIGIDWGTMFGLGSWIEPSLPPADEVLFPVFDLYIPDNPPAFYGWTDGYPVCNRAHPAGVLKDFGPTMTTELVQACLDRGIAVTNTEFAHPAIIPTYIGGAPVGYDDAGKMMQFIRSLDVAFDFDNTKFWVCSQSRGNWLNVTSMRATLKNISGPTYASRQDSFCTLHLNANTQTQYNSRRAFDDFCLPNTPDPSEAVNRANFYASSFGAPVNDLIPNMIDLINGTNGYTIAPQVPAMVTSYDSTYPGGKVAWTAINTAHWPQSGQLLLAAYQTRGIPQNLVVWDNSSAGGIPEQLGAYPEAAAEFFRGASLFDAMAAGLAQKQGHSAIGIRSPLVGVWQESTQVTAGVVGQSVGAVADLSQGIEEAATVPSLGVAGGQANNSQRTVLVTTAGGYGMSVAATRRLYVAYAGTSNDAREGRSWGLTARYDSPAQLPVSGIGFGSTQANGDTLVLMVAAPLGTAITDQHRKVYDFAAYARRAVWPTPVL